MVGAGRAPERRVAVLLGRMPQASVDLEMLDEVVLQQAERAAQALPVFLPAWERQP